MKSRSFRQLPEAERVEFQAEVEIREDDFSLEEEYRALVDSGTGACVLFSGLVRDISTDNSGTVLELEHYPGMVEAEISTIISEARGRWSLRRIRVIHRVGRLQQSDQIVLVGVSSAHRGDAFAACEFIMDYLKTRAPIWKKEGADGKHDWVEQRNSDLDATSRWT